MPLIFRGGSHGPSPRGCTGKPLHRRSEQTQSTVNSSIPRLCDGFAMPCLLPCVCHATAMLLPCLCHVVAMPLPCGCHAFAMPLPSRCHALPMCLQCLCNAVGMCSRCFSNVVATLLACCCKAVAMRLPCYCAHANWATTHGNNAVLFYALSFSLRRGFMDYHSICGVLFMEQQSLCPPCRRKFPM